MAYDSMLVYNESDPTREKTPVSLGAIEFSNLFLLITQQGEGEAVVLREGLVVPYTVGADANDLGSHFHELEVIVPVAARLPCTSDRLIFGVEVEDNVLVSSEFA